MAKKNYSQEDWWNCLTSAEREKLIGEMESEDKSGKICIDEPEEKPKPKKTFKARDLFGWG